MGAVQRLDLVLLQSEVGVRENNPDNCKKHGENAFKEPFSLLAQQKLEYIVFQL